MSDETGNDRPYPDTRNRTGPDTPQEKEKSRRGVANDTEAVAMRWNPFASPFPEGSLSTTLPWVKATDASVVTHPRPLEELIPRQRLGTELGTDLIALQRTEA